MSSWLRSRQFMLLIVTLVCGVALPGCTSIVSSAVSGLAESLSAAILDQDDPELVREAVPSYLLLLDSMVRSSPQDADVLGAAAELYAVYGSAFVDDPVRAQKLTSRAFDYGERALCASRASACGIRSLPYDDFALVVNDLPARTAGALFSYSLGSLAYVRAHSSDFSALTGLPKAELALLKLLEFGSDDNVGAINLYLGILNTLRPQALGGRPEVGRGYFEAAIAATGGRDLSAKVEFARGYARLVYDRDLHDKLLNEVLAGKVKHDGYTLVNSLAQEQARQLLATADDYF